jgi:hypothetical protein
MKSMILVLYSISLACCTLKHERNVKNSTAFLLATGPHLFSNNNARFVELTFQSNQPSRRVRLIIEYEELPGEPLTDFDLVRAIEIQEHELSITRRTNFDPWSGGPNDGGLLGDLVPQETQLESTSAGNYKLFFTECVPAGPYKKYCIQFKGGKYMGYREVQP